MSSTTSVSSQQKIGSFDWVRGLTIVLAIAGLGVSAYLMWGYTVPGVSLSCGQSSGCEAVKNSQYASLFGVPMPLGGLLIYSALLGLSIFQNHNRISERGWSPFVALAAFGISLAGVLYSAYLTYIELYVIYAVCRWCVASAVIMVAIFLLSIFNLRNSNNLS